MPDKPLKYLLVWERMGHYHVARWRALQDRIGRESAHAADLAASDSMYGWKTEWADDPQFHRLSDKPMEQKDAWGRFQAFRRICKEEKITVVAIAGYYRLELILMLIWGTLTGRRVVLFAESWYPGGRFSDGLKGIFLDWFCDGFLVSGDNARRHFADRLGIPEGRIQTGYSVVDNAHFAKAIKLRPDPTPKIVLCVARFTPEKNLSMLIKAFKNSELVGKGWKLRLVGGGPMKDELIRLVNNDPAIELKDWVAYEALPALYADASVFCLPSRFEPWGLVVNEAMAADLTLILSSDVGALPEAKRHTSVYIFSTHNESGLVVSLKEACRAGTVTHPRSMDDLSPESWAEKMVLLTR